MSVGPVPSGAAEYYNVHKPSSNVGYDKLDVITEKPDGTRQYWTREGYNNRNNRPVDRGRVRPGQGYTRTDPYSRTRVQLPSRQNPGPSAQPASQETSFTEAARERNPGIRQRNRPGNRIPGRSPASRPVETRISIPDQFEFETTPLLSGGATVTAAGASTGITGSTLAAGAGIAGGALAVGGITAAVANRIKEKGAVLPGTDYVGPGNDIKIDAARSGSDQVAKDHDIGYDHILAKARAGSLSEEEFYKNVQRLDDEAIRKFAENFRTSGEWQSFVGRYGLGLKQQIERVTGVLYPSFPGKIWVVNGKTFIHKTDRTGIRLTSRGGVMLWSNII